jgi:hypothetical protein
MTPFQLEDHLRARFPDVPWNDIYAQCFADVTGQAVLDALNNLGPEVGASDALAFFTDGVAIDRSARFRLVPVAAYLLSCANGEPGPRSHVVLILRVMTSPYV